MLLSLSRATQPTSRIRLEYTWTASSLSQPPTFYTKVRGGFLVLGYASQERRETEDSAVRKPTFHMCSRWVGVNFAAAWTSLELSFTRCGEPMHLPVTMAWLPSSVQGFRDARGCSKSQQRGTSVSNSSSRLDSKYSKHT